MLFFMLLCHDDVLSCSFLPSVIEMIERARFRAQRKRRDIDKREEDT